MTERLYIYDTTLRDGAQMEGVDFTATDKIAITELLDGFGIDYIEGGCPAPTQPTTASSKARPS